MGYVVDEGEGVEEGVLEVFDVGVVEVDGVYGLYEVFVVGWLVGSLVGC